MIKTMVVIIQDGKVMVFKGEVVETNLVEVHEQVSGYKINEKLPNWLAEVVK